MKSTFGVLVVCILSSYSLMAAESDADFVIVKQNKKEIIENSSEAHRINKQYTAHINITGIGPSFSSVPAVGLGYYIDRNKQILLDINSGLALRSRTLSEYDNGTWKTYGPETKTRQIAVSYKQFLGNSFYFKTGVVQNHVEYNYDLSSSAHSAKQSSSFSGDALLGQLTIGNQWQWDTFTLGCDWIGYAGNLYSKVASAKKPEPDTSSAQADFDQDQDFYLKGGSAVLLRFYLGASF